jgi:hypothetical protein
MTRVSNRKARRAEASDLVVVWVNPRRVRFPIGRSRQPGASACIRGSAPSSGWRRGRAGTGSGRVRRPAKWHRRAQVRRRSCGASLSMPARAAAARSASTSPMGPGGSGGRATSARPGSIDSGAARRQPAGRSAHASNSHFDFTKSDPALTKALAGALKLWPSTRCADDTVRVSRA